MIWLLGLLGCAPHLFNGREFSCEGDLRVVADRAIEVQVDDLGSGCRFRANADARPVWDGDTRIIDNPEFLIVSGIDSLEVAFSDLLLISAPDVVEAEVLGPGTLSASEDGIALTCDGCNGRLETDRWVDLTVSGGTVEMCSAGSGSAVLDEGAVVLTASNPAASWSFSGTGSVSAWVHESSFLAWDSGVTMGASYSRQVRCGEDRPVEADVDTDTDADADTDVDADTDSDADCDTFVVDTYPLAGQEDVSPRTDVRVRLSESDPFVWLELDSVAGEVLGEVSVDDDEATFYTDSDLDPSTSVWVEVFHECGVEGFEFTTSDVGPDVPDEFLAGRSWWFELSSPESDVIFDNTPFERPQILVGVTPGEIFAFAAAEAGEQDLCVPYQPIGADTFENPWLFAGLDALTLSNGIVLKSVVLDAAFSPDGQFLRHIDIIGYLDTRPYVGFVMPGGVDDTICQLLQGVGGTCVPCPTDAEPYCLGIDALGLTAEQLDGELVPRTEMDIALDSVNCAN